MTKRSVRLTLFLACVGAIGYAAFLTWSSEQHVRATGRSSTQFDITARGVSAGIAELRAAQQAYVAVGQGEEFWFARVSATLKDLGDKLNALKSVATAPEAVTAVDDASGALQDFEQMDSRARDYTRGRQLTLASDLVFTDGFDLTKKAGAAVERAVTAELVARDAFVGNLRRKEAIALAGAAGLATLGLLLLLRGDGGGTPTSRPRRSWTIGRRCRPIRSTICRTSASCRNRRSLKPRPGRPSTSEGWRRSARISRASRTLARSLVFSNARRRSFRPAVSSSGSPIRTGAN